MICREGHTKKYITTSSITTWGVAKGEGRNVGESGSDQTAHPENSKQGFNAHCKSLIQSRTFSSELVMISFLTSSSKQVGRDLHRWFFLSNLSLASRVTEPNVQLRNCVEQASLNHYFDDVNPRFSFGFLKGFSPRPFLPPLATPQVVIDDVVMYFLVCPSLHIMEIYW